jgi:Mn2+/Fe2+ NRAMP family transporter
MTPLLQRAGSHNWDRLLGFALVLAGLVFVIVGLYSGNSFVSGNKPGRDELMFMIGGTASIVSGALIAIFRPMK